MRLLDETTPKGRVNDLWSTLWAALVPATGKAGTTQGELLRSQGNLVREYYHNGMNNYYDECLAGADTDSYPRLLDFLLDTLLRETGDAYLAASKARILQDRSCAADAQRLQVTEEERELTPAEHAELERLTSHWNDWEDLLDRTELMVINYCIAHPVAAIEWLVAEEDTPDPIRAPSPAGSV